MLLPIEKLLRENDVQQLRQHLEGAHAVKAKLWLDGKRTAGSLARNVKDNLQLDETSDLARSLSQAVMQAVSQHPLFISATLPEKFYPPRFNCYQGGGSYGLHIDSSIMKRDDGETVRTDVSGTLFLSDADEYDGGELAIETAFGAQEIKLNAGDLILYPSTSMHEVRPVTRGKRFAAFFWIQSLVSDSTKREQLFELDQSIQVLTVDRGPEDQEVRRLSGLYHNLMRQWAMP